MPEPRYIVSLPVGGHLVGFYSSPRDVPDYPWFAYVDLLAACAVPDHVYAVWLDQGRRGWPELVHELPDETALVTMNTNDMLLSGLVRHGWDHVAKLRLG